MTEGAPGRKLVHGLYWMEKTAMGRYPTSLIEFQAAFGTEAACAAYLVELRWPNGFVCPACGSLRAWTLTTKAHTFECADCGRQTSVTAGTILHDSKLALTIWFLAAFLIATHSNALSARQPQYLLGRVCRLRPPDLGDRRHDPARQQAGADDLVPRRVPDRHSQQRPVGPPAAIPARARLVPDGVDAGRLAAPGDGRSAARAAVRADRGR